MNNYSFITFAPINPIPVPEEPAQKARVHLVLTIFLITLYGSIFIFLYFQLWRILWYGYKRFCFQTIFLMLILLWSSLRITLFSFYFENAQDANKLNFLLYYLFYCFPNFLQFCTLCLLTLFYGQVIFSTTTKKTQRSSKI
jgi:integral membrane protein GPR137